MSMETIRLEAETQDSPVIAASFVLGDATGTKLVRLLPEQLVEAESRALATIGANLDSTRTVGYAPARAIGFPAWPILNDPANAIHALLLIEDLEWARRQAGRRKADVKVRVDELATRLQAAAPGFVPTFLEEIARIFARANNMSFARQYFNKAREVERAHSLPIDLERHRAAFVEFTGLGVVGAREMSLEAKSAATRLNPGEAYEYFLSLAIDRARAGHEAYPNLLHDLRRLAKSAGLAQERADMDFFTEYVRTRAFARTPDTVMDKLRPIFASACAANPELKAELLANAPDSWGIAVWVEVLTQAGIFEHVLADGATFHEWLVARLRPVGDADCLVSNPEVCEAIVRHAPLFEGSTIPVSQWKVHPDYLDALVEAGTRPALDRWGDIRLARWLSGPSHRDLHFLAGAADVQDALMKSFDSCFFLRYPEKVGLAGMRTIAHKFLEHLARRRKEATGSGPRWEELFRDRENLTSVASEIHPSAVATVLSFDCAEELALRLRRGTLIEYTWPTFEKTCCETIRTTYPKTFGSFPKVGIQHEDLLYLIDGEQIESVGLPPKADVVRIFDFEGELVALTREPGGKNFAYWCESGIAAPSSKISNFAKDVSEYPLRSDTGMFIGTEEIRADKGLKNEPGGAILGIGPHYAVGGYRGTVVRNLETNESISIEELLDGLRRGLAGIETGAMDFSGTSPHSSLSSQSYCVRATANTMDSPLGVFNDVHTQLVFSSELSSGWAGSEELRYFSFVDEAGAGHPYPVIATPGGGKWYVKSNGYDRIELLDTVDQAPISSSLDAKGTSSPLMRLPLVGLHQLKIRNISVSKRMRTCDPQQAQQLLDNLESIYDFAEADETLAAAIAGIVAEINKVSPSKLAMPVIEEPPAWMEYLLESLGEHAPEKPEPSISNATTHTDSKAPKPEASLPELDRASFESLKSWLGIYGSNEQSLRRMLLMAQLLDERTGHSERGEHREPDQETHDAAIQCARMLGREKWIIFHLAAPQTQKEQVLSLGRFCEGLVKGGLLGHWHSATYLQQRQKSGVKRIGPVWCVVEDSGFSTVLYPAELTMEEVASLLPGEQLDFSDEFLPADVFLHELKMIVQWREKLEAPVLAGGVSLAEAARTMEELTAFPKVAWSLILLGVYPQGLGGSKEAAIRTLLGLKAAELKLVYRFISLLGGNLRSILAAGMRPNFANLGFDFVAMGKQWEQLYSASRIGLDDDAFFSLASMIVNSHWVTIMLDDDLEAITPSMVTDAATFGLAIALAHRVKPSTDAARLLATKLRRIGEVGVSYEGLEKVAIGGDIEQLELVEFSQQLGSRVISEGFGDKLLAYLETGTRASGYPEDPRVSAPEVVDKLAQHFELSATAATYYLCLLALSDARDEQLMRLLRWKKTQLKQAREELLARELVIEGKRSGAGRGVFLPGGWIERSAGNYPMETWKAPFYLLWKAPRIRPVIAGCPPLVPYGELYEQVWQRLLEGDTPGYEELNVEHYRGSSR